LESIYNSASIFLDIFSGLVPYFLMGLLLSAWVELFVPRVLIQKLTQNKAAMILSIFVLSVLLPTAKGGIIPLAHRLVKKGAPLYAAMALLVAGPLLNIITVWNTQTAFGWGWLLLARWGIGLLLAAGVGVIYSFQPEQPGLPADAGAVSSPTPPVNQWSQYWQTVLAEFLNWTPVFILGVFLAAVSRVLIPFATWLAIGQASIPVQIVSAMLYAAVLSISSTIDSFVILNWSGQVPLAVMTAFLLTGAVVDVRGLVMLIKGFGLKTTIFWALLVLLGILVSTLLIQTGSRGWL
jgi:uncharacterized membrane protein YraQ (UPF0718 family)